MVSRNAADVVALAEERKRRAELSGEESSENNRVEENANDSAEAGSMPSAASATSAGGSEGLSAGAGEAAGAEGGRGQPDEDFTSAGRMLRASREALGLSIDDIVDRTNIRPDRITALEEMRTDELPDAPYTLGFVRTYALVLDLPAEPLVARYRREAGFPPAGQTSAQPRKEGEEMGAPPQVSFIAVLAVLLIGAWLAWKVVESLAPETPAPSGIPLAQEVDTAPVASFAVEDARPGAPTAEDGAVPITPESVTAAAPEPLGPTRVAETSLPLLDGQIPPELRRSVDPVFPGRCEATADPQEVVVISFTVSRLGKVLAPQVESSSNACFNAAALSAVSRWDFVPASTDGVAVRSGTVTSRVLFTRP